ncbi:hypothetical protein Nocox_15505 [Nonomuraea coxensis DSM 45129]|uniref:DUF2567 domain-containing protein n=1 Tax=Nonomuraea coxensis DSM 45129 TaxID=1122611 RepID=A0ABX8TZ07_9ACTN|nr:hypothetical protein [Nonomuraea coxensis]QYC40716.1 hypothetical protein Nocox_15505 [Nonomuraea coxensis DSM 45129]
MTREVRAFAVTVLVLATLGIGAGLLWSAVSPRAPYQVTERGLVLADLSTQALIAADGWYAVITGGLGLLCGAAGWLAGRRWMLGVLAGLCVGGSAGAALTYWIGSTFTVGAATVEAAAVPGVKIVPGALALTANGVAVAWPLLAVGLFGLLEGMHGYRESSLRQPYGEGPLGGPLSGPLAGPSGGPLGGGDGSVRG